MIASIAVRTPNIIMRVMRGISLRRIYQVVAVLGLAIPYINITLVAIFVVTVSAIAYQNIVSMSAITVFVSVLWMWIPAIHVFCRHLLLG